MPPAAAGRPPARCLACSKAKGGSSWRRFLTRYSERHGEAAARQLAEAQGVPYRPASTGTSASVARAAAARKAPPPPKAAKGGAKRRSREPPAPVNALDAMELAVLLHLAGGDVRAAGSMLGRPVSPALEAAARAHKDLVEGSPGALGRLAFGNLALTLVRLQRRATDLAPGAMAQLVKPMRDLWQQTAGGTTASEINLIFEVEGE